MIDNFDFKEKYSFYDLVEIVKCLRSENGCPWDIEQNHESIKKNFIEETYEVIEAINKKDSALLCEELGDVMLQVVFHSEMEAENEVFNIDDVSDGICKKLIERHPHVFGNIKVKNTDEVLKNWDDIKKSSKGQKSQTDSMVSIPRELPALMRATKIQQKAAKVGFDWDDVTGAILKLDEEVAELKEAIQINNIDNIQEELGDLFFTVVNVSRFVKCDAEESLTFANDKFISRFSKLEKLACDKGIDMKNADIKTLDELWDEVKLMNPNETS